MNGSAGQIADEDLRDVWASLLRQLNAMDYLRVDPFSLQIGIGERGRDFQRQVSNSKSSGNGGDTDIGILPLKKLFVKAPKPPKPATVPKAKRAGGGKKKKSQRSAAATSTSAARYSYRGGPSSYRSNSRYEYDRYDRF